MEREGISLTDHTTCSLPNDKQIDAIQEEPICNVSDYISRVRKYIESREGEDYLFVYRGEPQYYTTSCRANIFRRGVMDGNPFFEKSLFDAMRQNRLTGEKRYLDNAIDAQHGEFPSRLLDVSYNCLTALYFAVTPYYRKAENSLDHEDGMVFIFFVDEIFSPSARNTNDNYDAIINRDREWHRDKIIFEKNHKFIDHTKLNNRIIAQQGAFILFQGNDAADLPAWMTYGIRIPKETKPLIRKELKQFFGIHTGTIYPEIMNLVEDISNKSRKLNTEEFSCYHELRYAVRLLEKELDYYFDYILDHRKQDGLDRILVYVENIINSYRIGLLDFAQTMTEAIRKSYLKEEELRSVTSRYNELILEFARELRQHGVCAFSGDQLLIDTEGTKDHERKSDQFQENQEL